MVMLVLTCFTFLSFSLSVSLFLARGMLAWPWGNYMETTSAKLPSLALRPWIWALRTCANSSHCWRSGSMMQVCPWTHLNEQYRSTWHEGRMLWSLCICILRFPHIYIDLLWWAKGSVGCVSFTVPCLYLPSLALCLHCLCREPDIWPGPVQPQCPGLPGHGHRGDQPQTEEEDQYWDQHPSGLRKELSGGEKLAFLKWTILI